MGGGGSSDTETYFNVKLSSQRVLEDGQLYDALVRAAAEKPTIDGYTVINTWDSLNSSGAYQLMNYYNFSTWYDTDSLPTASVQGTAIPTDLIKGILGTKNNVPSNSIESLLTSWTFPSIQDWGDYWLQEYYSYDLDSNFLLYNGKYHRLINYFRTLGTTDTTATAVLSTLASYTTSVHSQVQTIISNYSDTQKQKIVITTEVTTITTGSEVILTTEVEKSRVESFIAITSTEQSGTVYTKISEEVTTDTVRNVEIAIPNIIQSPAYISTYIVSNRLKIWVYYPFLGDYPSIGQVNIPSLQAPFSGTTYLDMYPITLLRQNYFSIDEWTINQKSLPAGDKDLVVYRPDAITEEEYELTDYTVSVLGLTLEDILNSINTNPDIDKISDTFLMCGINPLDTHPIVARLLFEFFIEVNNKTPVFDAEGFTLTVARGPYNIALEWTTASIETISGVIGEEDFCSHSIVEESTNYKDRVYEVTQLGYPWSPTGSRIHEYIETYTLQTYTTGTWEEGVVEHTEKKIISTEVISDTTTSQIITPVREVTRLSSPSSGSVLTVRKQITPAAYQEIVVGGLAGVTLIGRQYQDTTKNTATNTDLIIPLPKEVIDKMTPIEKIEVMERSLRFLFYAAELHIVELEWYETGLFQSILQVLSIAIVIAFNFIPGLGTATSAALMATLQAFAVGVAIQLAIKLITAIVDIPFLEQILAVAAIVASVAMGNIDLTSFKDLVMTGVELVEIASEVATGIIAQDTQDILNETAALERRYETVFEEYEEISEGLKDVGVSTEFLAELMTSGQEYVIPADQYYSLQFETLYNYDLLFNSGYDSVNKFYDNNIKTI